VHANEEKEEKEEKGASSRVAVEDRQESEEVTAVIDVEEEAVCKEATDIEHDVQVADADTNREQDTESSVEAASAEEQPTGDDPVQDAQSKPTQVPDTVAPAPPVDEAASPPAEPANEVVAESVDPLRGEAEAGAPPSHPHAPIALADSANVLSGPTLTKLPKSQATPKTQATPNTEATSDPAPAPGSTVASEDPRSKTKTNKKRDRGKGSSPAKGPHQKDTLTESDGTPEQHSESAESDGKARASGSNPRRRQRSHSRSSRVGGGGSPPEPSDERLGTESGTLELGASVDSSALQRELSRLENRLIARFESRLDKQRRADEAARADLQRTLVADTAAAVQTQVAALLKEEAAASDARLRATMRQTVSQLERAVRNTISESTAATPSVSDASAAFRDHFANVLVPSFEAASREMVSQLSMAFQAHIEKHLTPLVRAQVEHVLSDLTNAPPTLSSTSTSTSTAAAATPPQVLVPVVQAPSTSSSSVPSTEVPISAAELFQSAQQHQQQIVHEPRRDRSNSGRRPAPGPRSAQATLPYVQTASPQASAVDAAASQDVVTSALKAQLGIGVVPSLPTAAAPDAPALQPVVPPPTELNPVVSLQTQIVELLKANKYEDAFQEALGAHNLDLLVWLCSCLDHRRVFTTRPLPLSQRVILCLIQQLGTNLAKQTQVKFAWLRSALSAADPKAANVPERTAHLILTQVSQNLSALYQQMQHQPTTPAKDMLMKELVTLMQMCSSLFK